jgi:hypothetical protein
MFLNELNGANEEHAIFRPFLEQTWFIFSPALVYF